jgi:hypothetical protein
VARALRRSGLTLALPALVGCSTLLYWLAGRRLTGLWIMPDEAIYAGRAIGFWRHFSLPVLHGAGAGYSVLYPVVAGLPLAVGSINRGYESLKLLQALVASLAAVPVVFYGRRLMPTPYAFLAATLTVASPLLLYSGLVMTEVVYYPLAAAALLAISHAVATTRLRDQAIAFGLIVACVLTRVQAVVLVAVFALAILVERRRLRAFWPVWAVLAVAVAASAARPGLFGAYAGTLTGSYPVGDSVKFVYYHLAYVVLMTSVVPAAALAILGVELVRGRLREPEQRAFVVVASTAIVLVVLQVGLFAARYAPHLLGRDLAALPPLLFVALALWLARGCPRPGLAASVIVLALGALVLTAPWNDLVADNALPDTLGLATFLESSSKHVATEIAVVATVALVLVRFIPRRVALVLPALVLASLVASSVSASNLLARKVAFDQAALVGTPPDWIERATTEPVAYVYNGDIASWNVVWQQRFWNPRIDGVVSLAPFSVPGPLPSKQIHLPADGRLGIREHYVVANDVDAFVGTPVAHQSRGTEQFGLTLWRVPQPVRISTITAGVNVNGDIETRASVTALDCRGGTLQLTLLPKATPTVSIYLDGKLAVRAHIDGLPYWNGSVGVPLTHRSNRCVFTIRGGLLLGSTHIGFVPRS